LDFADPGMPTAYYHVSPSENRESILTQGLVPQRKYWSDLRKIMPQLQNAPEGVYLWDSFDNARTYINAFVQENVMSLPENVDEWSQHVDFREDWLDGMGNWTEEVPAYDIWKVNAAFVTPKVEMDPESWIKDQDIESFESAEESYDPENPTYAEEQGHRYLVTEIVPPEQIELVETIPITDLGVYDFEDHRGQMVHGPLTRVPDLLESPVADPNYQHPKVSALVSVDWDDDGEAKPSLIDIPLEILEQELDGGGQVANWLSNTYGWMVNDWKFVDHPDDLGDDQSPLWHEG
jgi:hypothetical protein